MSHITNLVDGVTTLNDKFKETHDYYDKKIENTNTYYNNKFEEVDVKFDKIKYIIEENRKKCNFKIKDLKRDIAMRELSNTLSLYRTIISLRITCIIFCIYFIYIDFETSLVFIPFLIINIIRFCKDVYKHDMDNKFYKSLKGVEYRDET